MAGSRLGGCVAIAVALVAVACGTPQATPAPTPNGTVIAKVGPTSITQAQFDLRFASVTASLAQSGAQNSSGPTASAMIASVRASIMRSLITDAVIAQGAAAAGVAATPADVDAEIALDRQAVGGAAQLQSQLAAAGGSMDQLRDETLARLNDQRLENYVAQQRAADVENQLAHGGQFAALAKQYSDDTQTAPNGGDVGVMTQAALAAGDPAFKAAVLALKAGQTTTAPARDSTGYEILHVAQVTAQGPEVLRILVAAPQPFTVQDRPSWYAEAVLLQLSTLCAEHQVVVYIDAGNQPCVAAGTPTPSPSPQR